MELKARVKDPNLINHSLAVDAIMRALAITLKENVENWGLAGLFHDIDYERTSGDPSRHSLVGAEILENLGVDREVVYAVRAHNFHHGIKRKRKIDKALYCTDAVSGFIVVAALVISSRKLSDVTRDFLIEKMDDENFAKGVDRHQLKSCSEIGLSLEEFIDTSLEAMKGISDQLEL